MFTNKAFSQITYWKIDYIGFQWLTHLTSQPSVFIELENFFLGEEVGMFAEHGKTGIDNGRMVNFSGLDINSIIFDYGQVQVFW